MAAAAAPAAPLPTAPTTSRRCSPVKQESMDAITDLLQATLCKIETASPAPAPSSSSTLAPRRGVNVLSLQNLAETNTAALTPALTPVPPPAANTTSSSVPCTPTNACKTANVTPRKARLTRRLTWSDERGGQLEHKCHFSKYDEPYRCGRRPHARPTVQADLDIGATLTDSSTVLAFDSAQLCAPHLMAERACQQGVVLEQINVRLPYIFCTVRVANLAYAKSVKIKYTCDNWATSDVVEGAWISSGLERDTERFVATISLYNFRLIKNLQLCVQYNAADQERWDSADGRNYQLRQVSRADARTLSPPPYRKWQQQGAWHDSCLGAFL
ncbi:uncharacterized protein MONBRDRAFT_12636 [Monosiga brevicollis MX1]|uniref:CBM21 domain-containing protein n=1 Tax=Monosiga brevicollis TaxID=81824 RepID=A9VCV2_MONBE|nr:uncharacterized protein MONBRDRAFT_12636 [Monosiga brevicollis MX1]EDQ84631.1 predicted protein [Monosiga brevicollis MX1]|eukprot:XP_001750535.1 hypothetical protein [Monosiga brevicollis MX1]